MTENPEWFGLPQQDPCMYAVIEKARAQLPLASENGRNLRWIEVRIPDLVPHAYMVCFRKHYVDGICVGWEYAGMK